MATHKLKLPRIPAKPALLRYEFDWQIPSTTCISSSRINYRVLFFIEMIFSSKHSLNRLCRRISGKISLDWQQKVKEIPSMLIWSIIFNHFQSFSELFVFVLHEELSRIRSCPTYVDFLAVRWEGDLPSCLATDFLCWNQLHLNHFVVCCESKPI